jgi:hypothetical protein
MKNRKFKYHFGIWKIMTTVLIVMIIAFTLFNIEISQTNIAQFNIQNTLSLNTIKSLAKPRSKNIFYVDCMNGSDSNNGESENSAWKSVKKANTDLQYPVKSLLLKRDCTWEEPLVILLSGSASQNLIIGAYGNGDIPVIQSSTFNVVTIKGSYVEIQDIYAKVVATNFEAECSNNPKGEISGFLFESGSSNNTLKNSKTSGAYAGVYINNNSHNNKIQHNLLIDNNMMYLNLSPDDDHGAFGVLLKGDDNEVSYNTISGSIACSYDYVSDGSAVEVYGGQRNITKYNYAYDNDSFTELGNSRSSDNIYAYNLVTSSLPRSYFLVTRGVSKWGPVYRTSAYNNTVFLTSNSSTGFACIACNADILTLKNNIIWTNGKIGYLEGSFDDEFNIYWGSVVNFPISPTSKITNPQFISPGLNFHLQNGSPAIDSGLQTLFTNDLDNNQVPQGISTDLGAYEY